jgi:MFS transporter, DHA2 family, multidrug resistance protein
VKYRRSLMERYPSLHPENPSYRWLVMGTVMITTFMAVLDATIVNVALSKMMAAFGVSVDSVEWVLTAYLLAFGVILPTSGWLADHIGYKRIFLLGVFLFTLGSLLCSLAWSIDTLIAFRVLQGAGAGILMPVGMAIITREFPPNKRGLALGVWSISASASVSLGPWIGGYLIDHYAWHTIFDVNIPVGIFGMAALIIVLREYRSEETRSFDLIGLVSLIGFLTSLLLALSNGNSAWNTGGWTSSFIVTCFSISLVSLVIFLTTEMTVLHPLIEISLFRSINFTLSNLVSFLFGMGMFGSTFLLPIYLQNSLGYTPMQAGAVFLPVGVLQAFSAPLAGQFSDKYGGKFPMLIGLIIMAYTFWEYSYLSQFSERPEILLPLYLRGFGMGILFSPLTMMALSEVPNSKVAQASGLINVIRQIGGSFGVAIFGSVLTRRTIYHASTFGQQIDPNSEIFRETMTRLKGHVIASTGGTTAEATLKAKSAVGMFVQKQAFIQAIDDVFRLAAIIIFISVIPVFFLHKYKRRPKPGMAAVD